jgi:hypothetical protein
MKKQVVTIGIVASLLSSIACSQNQSRVQAVEVEPFTDVNSSFWAFKEIEDLRKKGVVEALTGKQFAPNKEITRSKAARMMIKALGAENEKYKEISFSDVTKNHPDYKYIAIAVNHGIFSGKTDGTFDPNGNLTRAQMAKILTLTLDLEVKGKHPFTDVSSIHWANEYINALYSNQITTGTNGKYLPGDSVKRVQQAVFLHRGLPTGTTEPQPEPPVITNPPEIKTLEEFNASIKNNPLFASGIQTNSGTFIDPYSKKALLEGQELFKNTNFKYVDLNYSIDWKTPGYKNPKDPNFPQLLLESFNGSFTISFDFRDDKAVELATKLLELFIPNLGLKEEIIKRAKEAKELDASGINEFRGNRERFLVGDYEIFAGVHGFLEFGDIHVRKIR